MSDYKSIISNFRGKKIAVIGDIILDQHIRGSVSRISPEAPVPVVLQQGNPSFAPGGAANVANNLRGLGARVALVGRMGKDPESKILQQELRKHKIPLTGIFTDSRFPTVVKTRIVAQHQQVLRVDREIVEEDESGPVVNKILKFLDKNLSGLDAVIVSDYGKGLISRELIEQVCQRVLGAGKVLTVDPKVEHFAYYRGVTCITPNRQEAENAIRNIKIGHDSRGKLKIKTDQLKAYSDVEQAAKQLLNFLDLQSLMITLGEDGMCLLERGKKPVHIHTRARDVFDVTGAGDTVISIFTLALTAGATKLQAADLANYAAGIVVGKMGPVTFTPQDLLDATGVRN